MKFLSLSLVLLAFTSPSWAHLSTEFKAQLNAKKVNQLLHAYVPLEIPIQDQEIDLSDFKKPEGMSFSKMILNMKVSPQVHMEEQGELQGEFQAERAEIKLTDFNYLDYMYIDQGAVKAKVKVKVRCSTLPLTFNNTQGHLNSQLKIHEGEVSLTPSKDLLSLNISDIGVDLSQCEEAPKNIESLFSDEIRDWLLKPSGQEVLTEALIEYLEVFLTDFLKEDFKSIEFLNQFLSIKDLSLGHRNHQTLVRGRLELSSTEDRSVQWEREPQSQSNKRNKILFPKDFVSVLLPKMVKSIKLPLSFKRAEIPGVEALFKNKLIQLFAWGDLGNFKDDANFQLDISLFNNVISNMNMQRGRLTARVQNHHWIDMNFLGGSKVYPYMHFIGSTDVNVDVGFKKDKLHLKLKETDAFTNALWNQKMGEWRTTKVGSKPSLSLILPRVLKSLKGLETEFSLNELLGAEVFQSIHMNRDRESFYLDFE